MNELGAINSSTGYEMREPAANSKQRQMLTKQGMNKCMKLLTRNK